MGVELHAGFHRSFLFETSNVLTLLERTTETLHLGKRFVVHFSCTSSKFSEDYCRLEKICPSSLEIEL